MLPASEEDEMATVDVKGRNAVAHSLYCIRCRVMYCLPHLFKDGLDINRERTDVFVNRCGWFFVCHMFLVVSYQLKCTGSYILPYSSCCLKADSLSLPISYLSVSRVN